MINEVIIICSIIAYLFIGYIRTACMCGLPHWEMFIWPYLMIKNWFKND